jgi:[acyl-carrier-protein] S-malonyltransferase
MASLVFMFPGVGSHYPGMGKYFYDHFSIARETFEEASDTLGTGYGRTMHQQVTQGGS